MTPGGGENNDALDASVVIRHADGTAEIRGFTRERRDPGAAIRDALRLLAFGEPLAVLARQDLSDIDAELLALRGRVDQLETAMRHVINASPGTPDAVKTYLIRELEGSWGRTYEQAMLP